MCMQCGNCGTEHSFSMDDGIDNWENQGWDRHGKDN